ncbi:hypothetical protein [Microbacterium maritypicum]
MNPDRIDVSATRGWRRFFDNPTPLMKQGPTAIAVGVAALLVAAVPGIPMTNPAAVAAGVIAVAVVTLLAAVFAARGVFDGWAVMLIPIVDLLGIGALRTGTGGAASLFSSLVLLPVIWIAAAPGIRQVFIVGLFTSIALLMPNLVDPPEDAVDWLRGVIGPIVFAVVGAIVNELSRLHRLRTSQAEARTIERTAALVANEQTLAQLKDSEQQYRALSESFTSLWNSITGQAVIATDNCGTITAWNPGAVRLLGMRVREALDDVRVDRFFDAEMLDQFADQKRRLSCGSAPPRAACAVRRGGQRPLRRRRHRRAHGRRIGCARPRDGVPLSGRRRIASRLPAGDHGRDARRRGRAHEGRVRRHDLARAPHPAQRDHRIPRPPPERPRPAPHG